MELLHLWSVILLFLSPFITAFLLIKQRNPPQNAAVLPPSPPKLPVIGHLHLLFGGLPHRALRRVSQKYGPVAHLQLGQIFSVVVSSREAARQVLKAQDPACADRADSINSRIMCYDNSDLVFSPYGPHWRQLRKICVSELLSPRNVASFGSIRQDEVSRLVLSLQSAAGQAVDLTEMISATTCAVICRAAFGRVLRGSDVLAALMKTAGMATGYELVDLFPSSRLLNLLCWNKYRLWGMRRRLDAILEVIVEEHRRKRSGEFGGEDIIDVLLRMQKDNNLRVPLTTETIKGFIFDMFSAGTETSSTTTIWAMAELMTNPAVMVKAQEEVRSVLKGKSNVDVSDVQQLKYLRSVVKETLRLHPPFPLIPRKCREEFELNGYLIPVESSVTINVWAMGRDPLYWEEPEVFRPERFDGVSTDFIGNDFEFIPFGAGRRICPGLNFGLASIEVPLAQLLYHFDWKLPKGMSYADVDMAEAKGLFGTKKSALLLVPTLYNPSPST